MNAKLLLATGLVSALIGTAALAQGPEGKRGDRAENMFSRMDTNKDGSITVAEMRAGRGEMFTRIDSNKDGKVTKAEAEAGRKRGPGPGGDGRGGPGGPGGREGGLAAADTNKDGIVTRAEWDAQPMPMFDRADANKDGRLTLQEMTAMRGGPRPG
jgi:hypothetical protein